MIGVGCSDKDCYVLLHDVCAAAGISKCWGGLQHQHIPKRSQGGKKSRVMLCAGHHDCIDNGTRYEGLRLSNHLAGKVYRIKDRDTGETLREATL